MTDPYSPELWQAQSDEAFLGKLAEFLQALEQQPAAEAADILHKLRILGYPPCGRCGGPIESLGGSQSAVWVHVEASDRATPHRATPCSPGRSTQSVDAGETHSSQDEVQQQTCEPECPGAQDDDRGESQ